MRFPSVPCFSSNSGSFRSSDSTYDSELCKLSDVLIISEDFLKLGYLEEDYHKIFNEYHNKCPGLVIFTFGEEALWYGRDSKKEFTPFKVKVIETAGAGDAFRAGIMFGILNNFTDFKLVQFASAVSAAIVQTYPGVINFQNIQEVNRIINSI